MKKRGAETAALSQCNTAINAALIRDGEKSAALFKKLASSCCEQPHSMWEYIQGSESKRPNLLSINEAAQAEMYSYVTY